MESISNHSPTSSPRPHVTIRPRVGWQIINVREIWQFRDLLLSLASRDVKLRYRQTALGALWVILQPLLGAGILSFVFNRVANLPTGGLPPIIFSYVGMLGFTLFSSTLTKSSSSLVGNSQLVSKVYFPRLLLPLSSVLSSLVDFVVGLGMLILLLIIYRIPPTIAMLTLPLWMAFILMLSLGAGLFFSAIMVTYRDVQYVLPVAVSFLTLASPVAYSVAFVASRTPDGYEFLYFLLNPLASLLEAMRWSLVGSNDILWPYVAFSAILAIVVFLSGAFSFCQMEEKFADVI